MSNAIITRWEADNKCIVSDKKHKSNVLKNLVRRCGLSTSMSVAKLRTVLQSLKRKSLPISSAEVDSMLISRNEPLSGVYVLQ